MEPSLYPGDYGYTEIHDEEPPTLAKCRNCGKTYDVNLHGWACCDKRSSFPVTAEQARIEGEITAIVQQIKAPLSGRVLAEVRALEADLVEWIGRLRKAAPMADWGAVA